MLAAAFVQGFAAPTIEAEPPAAGGARRELTHRLFKEPTVLYSTWTEDHAAQQMQQPTHCGDADKKTADWCARKVEKMKTKGSTFDLEAMTQDVEEPDAAAACYDMKPKAWCEKKIQKTQKYPDPVTGEMVGGPSLSPAPAQSRGTDASSPPCPPPPASLLSPPPSPPQPTLSPPLSPRPLPHAPIQPPPYRRPPRSIGGASCPEAIHCRSCYPSIASILSIFAHLSFECSQIPSQGSTAKIEEVRRFPHRSVPAPRVEPKGLEKCSRGLRQQTRQSSKRHPMRLWKFHALRGRPLC